MIHMGLPLPGMKAKWGCPSGDPSLAFLLLRSSRVGLAALPASELGSPLMYYRTSAYCLGICGKILRSLSCPLGAW